MMTHAWMKPFEECGRVSEQTPYPNLWLAFELQRVPLATNDMTRFAAVEADRRIAKEHNIRIQDAAEETAEALAQKGVIVRHGLSPEPVNFFPAELTPGQKLYVGVARMMDTFDDVRAVIPKIRLKGHGVFSLTAYEPSASHDGWPPGETALVFRPHGR